MRLFGIRRMRRGGERLSLHHVYRKLGDVAFDMLGCRRHLDVHGRGVDRRAGSLRILHAKLSVMFGVGRLRRDGKRRIVHDIRVWLGQLSFELLGEDVHL